MTNRSQSHPKKTLFRYSRGGEDAQLHQVSRVTGTSKDGAPEDKSHPIFAPQMSARPSETDSAPVELLPTAQPGMDGTTQVATTVTLGFWELFKTSTGLLGYTPAEAQRVAMQQFMKQCSKDAKIHASIYAKLALAKVRAERVSMRRQTPLKVTKEHRGLTGEPIRDDNQG